MAGGATTTTEIGTVGMVAVVQEGDRGMLCSIAHRFFM